MKIHEYQAKEVLRQFEVPTPRGSVCFSVDEAESAARKLGGAVWVVKAQIHAGGRGKGGGVKVARSLAEVREHAETILGMRLITHQTGVEGQTVRRLLIEEGAQIAKEYYVGMVPTRRMPWWTRAERRARALRVPRGAAIARRHIDRLHLGRLRQLPGQRVFAATTTYYQDLHAPAFTSWCISLILCI